MKSVLVVFLVLVISGAFAWAESETIFEVIKKGNVEEVKNMVSAKKDVDVKDQYGRTPLMLAAEEANMQIVKALIEAGADIDAKDKGFTVIDQLESILRRTGENKKRTIEKMRRDGFSEQLIESLIKDAAALHESPEKIRNWQGILDYLKQVKESKGKKNAGPQKPSEGSLSNRVEEGEGVSPTNKP